MKNTTVVYQPNLTDTEFASGSLTSFMVYREFANAKEDYPDKEILAYDINDIEEPTFVDDDDDRTINYYVDIPQVDGDELLCVGTFKTKAEAIEFAMKDYGADENGMICLVK